MSYDKPISYENTIVDPINDDIADLLLEEALAETEFIESRIYFKTRLCSCEECKFHSKEEQGWEVCPEHADENFLERASWLYSSMSTSEATAIGFEPVQYRRVEDLNPTDLKDYLSVNNYNLSSNPGATSGD